ncbi:MAG: C4-type zinc ribbon domain-containing protein [Chitinophagaceae bacterium]
MAALKEFSVKEKLESLLYLQKIDSKINDIKKVRGELPMEVKDLEDEIEGLNTRIANIDNEIELIDQDIQNNKNKQAEAKDLLKKYEKQQNNVKNSREFEAINKEISLQELEVQACERKIKDANEDKQVHEGNKMKIVALIEEKNEVLKLKQKELKVIVAETEKEEEALLKKRVKAEEDVEERLLVSYNKIRSTFRNGLAVVAVERDSCGGCFNVIPPQRQSDIRLHKKMIICEHCGRVLVDDELNEKVSL